MHHSPSLRSLLALAMVSAAGATIAATPRRAEDIANGIKSALDVLAPEHEVQGQPSGPAVLNCRIDVAKFAESVATGQLARGGVTGGLGPIPTVVVNPGGSIAGVAASIPQPKSGLEEAAEKYARACADVDALDALAYSAHEELQKAEQNLRNAQDAKKEAAEALPLAATIFFGVDANGVYLRSPIQKQ